MVLTRIKGAIFDGSISVKDFGAKGDGVTDDTVAIQDALDALPSARADLYFPAGLYILSAQLTHTNAPIKMFGAGIGVTILRWTAGAGTRGILITQDVDTHHTEVSGMSLHTLANALGTAVTVNMAGQLSGGLIQNRLNFRMILRDLDMRGDTGVSTDAWNWGVECIDVMHSVIDHCFVAGKKNATVFTNTSSGGFHISGAGSPTVIQFTRCLVYYGLDGILAENFEGITITDCNFVTCTRGVKYTDTDAGNGLFQTILNTHFSTFENAVVTTGGITALQMTGCWMSVRGDGDSAVNFVFLDLDNIKNSKIVDCTFNGAGSPSATVTGIHFKETDVTQDNYVVRPFITSLDTGIKVDSGIVSIRIEDPHFSSVVTELDDSATGTVQNFYEETKYKIADQDVTSSTTFVKDTEMQNWVLRAHSYYRIQGVFKCDTDTSATPGIQIRLSTNNAFQASGCNAIRMVPSGAEPTPAAAYYDSTADFVGDALKIDLLANDSGEVVLHGWIQTHATLSSIVDVEWTQRTSNATRTRCRHGTRITFTKMGSDS